MTVPRLALPALLLLAAVAAGQDGGGIGGVTPPPATKDPRVKHLRLEAVDGVYELFVPRSHDPDGSRSAPVVVALHPAGTPASAMIDWLRDGAETRGWVIVAPQSRGPRWLDPDAATIVAALEDAAGRVRLDPGRVCLAGYSSGAMMATRWGLPEHERFAALFAHAGVHLDGDWQKAAGRVPVRLSCGEADEFLPEVKAARERLVEAGFDVDLETFPGVAHHAAPPAVWDGGWRWFEDRLGRPGARLARATRARTEDRLADAAAELAALAAVPDLDKRLAREMKKERTRLDREGKDRVKTVKRAARRDPEGTRRALERLAADLAGFEAGDKAREALAELEAD